LALYIATVTVQEGAVFFAPEHRLELISNGVGVLLAAALAVTRWRWFHAVGLAVNLAVLGSRYFLWTTATTL
jgi:hypothetical protein